MIRDDGYSAEPDKKYKGYNSYVNQRTYSHPYDPN